MSYVIFYDIEANCMVSWRLRYASLMSLHLAWQLFMVHVSTALSSSVCNDILMHRHAICMQCEQNLSGVARPLVVDPWRKSRGGASVAPSPRKKHLQSNRKMKWSHKSSHTTSHGSWNVTRIIDHCPFNLIFKATIQKDLKPSRTPPSTSKLVQHQAHLSHPLTSPAPSVHWPWVVESDVMTPSHWAPWPLHGIHSKPIWWCKRPGCVEPRPAPVAASPTKGPPGCWNSRPRKRINESRRNQQINGITK